MKMWFECGKPSSKPNDKSYINIYSMMIIGNYRYSYRYRMIQELLEQNYIYIYYNMRLHNGYVTYSNAIEHPIPAILNKSPYI